MSFISTLYLIIYFTVAAVSQDGVNTGDGTYYSPGLGACGVTSGPGDKLVAVSASVFGAQSNGNPICGKCILVTGPAGSIELPILDKCPSCNQWDLDIAQAAFPSIASMAAGRVQVSWKFVACGSSSASPTPLVGSSSPSSSSTSSSTTSSSSTSSNAGSTTSNANSAASGGSNSTVNGTTVVNSTSQKNTQAAKKTTSSAISLNVADFPTITALIVFLLLRMTLEDF